MEIDCTSPNLTISSDTEKVLINALESVSDWYLLGINLDLKVSDLEIIRENHAGNSRCCMTEMLACWVLQCTNPTWEAVAKALDLMKERRVASDIKKKYIITSASTEGSCKGSYLCCTKKKNKNSI